MPYLSANATPALGDGSRVLRSCMSLTKQYGLAQRWLADLSEDALNPEFVAAVRSTDDSALDAFVRKPQAGVVEFPLLSEAFTQGLLRELHAFEHWCRRHQQLPARPNSMNDFGVVLGELGLDDAMDELLHSWLLPLTRRFFPDHAGGELDYQHAFVVDYSEHGDTSLDFHVDDSEVTLNVCLGQEFGGAEVYFRGERCDAHRMEPANDAESWQWSPRPGLAILHAGAHRHGVHPFRSGRRINLIVWARSSLHRRMHPEPHVGPVGWCSACKAA